MAFCVSKKLCMFLGSSACGILYKVGKLKLKRLKIIVAVLLVSFIPFVQYFLGVNYYLGDLAINWFVSLDFYLCFSLRHIISC